MAVERIVPNLRAPDPTALAAFYARVFGIETKMDMGWIVFLEAASSGPHKLQLASEGGSGADLPAITIEVDNLDDALARLREEGLEPTYGPVKEPWGIHRFFLTDPAGNLVNVATHYK